MCSLCTWYYSKHFTNISIFNSVFSFSSYLFFQVNILVKHIHLEKCTCSKHSTFLPSFFFDPHILVNNPPHFRKHAPTHPLVPLTLSPACSVPSDERLDGNAAQYHQAWPHPLQGLICHRWKLLPNLLTSPRSPASCVCNLFTT